MTLTEFLLARTAEDEVAARATLAAHDPLDWDTTPAHLMNGGAVGLDGPVDGPSGYSSVVVDPARVLAECEAKRRIVGIHHPGKYRPDECQVCFDPTTAAGDYDFEYLPCSTLRALALPYTDHPDYQDEWRP
jgi:hypothetical protein